MSIISQLCRSPSSLKIKSKAVSKECDPKILCFFSLLCSVQQPNPTHQPLKVKLNALGISLPPPSPISPGSGLNWEICGWDSEGRCGGGGGESCFLKFYLPSSLGISAVLCPAFSFVLDGAGHKFPWLTWQGYQCFVCSPIFAVACFVFVSC